MKKSFYIFLLLFGIVGCQDSSDYPFQGKDAVYFQLNSNDAYWQITQDSMVYTFAGKGVEEDTLWVRVSLQGKMTEESRTVFVVTDAEKTTAEVGLHYEALKPAYELPGNTAYMKVPVVIYKKDKELDNTKVVIALKLSPSETLDLGITERVRCRLIVSNTLDKPTYWESNIHYYFGAYSRKKHELCIEQLKRNFPEEGKEFTDQYNMWKVYGQYMSDYFKAHYPVYDENGVAIEPW